MISLARILAMLGMVLLLRASWWLARRIAIPRGWVRAARLLAWLSRKTWAQERASGAILAAAWAQAFRPEARPSELAALEAALGQQKPVGATTLVAAGLVAAARGDHDSARMWMASAAELSGRAAPRAALRLALEWRCADAVARGDWAAVRALGTQLNDGLGRFFALVAARFLGEAIGAAELRRGWRRAPRRQALVPLLEQALAWQPHGVAPTDAVAAEDENPYRAVEQSLRRAVARHAALASASVRSPADLVAAATAWDAALADGAKRLAHERALVLGGQAERALAAVVTDVESELADMTIAEGVVLPDAAGVLAGVKRRVRARLLGEVEQAARALQSRVAAGRVLPALHEWREVLALRALYERAGRLGGLELRRLVFEELHAAVCPLACRLWNERGERALAKPLFAWLYAEATAVGHGRLAEHEKRNVSTS